MASFLNPPPGCGSSPCEANGSRTITPAVPSLLAASVKRSSSTVSATRKKPSPPGSECGSRHHDRPPAPPARAARSAPRARPPGTGHPHVDGPLGSRDRRNRCPSARALTAASLRDWNVGDVARQATSSDDSRARLPPAAWIPRYGPVSMNVFTVRSGAMRAAGPDRPTEPPPRHVERLRHRVEFDRHRRRIRRIPGCSGADSRRIAISANTRDRVRSRTAPRSAQKPMACPRSTRRERVAVVGLFG